MHIRWLQRAVVVGRLGELRALSHCLPVSGPAHLAGSTPHALSRTRAAVQQLKPMLLRLHPQGVMAALKRHIVVASIAISMFSLGRCFLPPTLERAASITILKPMRRPTTMPLWTSSRPEGDSIASGRRSQGGRKLPPRPDGDDDDDNGDAMEEREYRASRPPSLDRERPRPRREARRNKLPFGIPWIPQGLSAALLAGVFVLGVGTGVTVDSAINTNPKDLASRDAIDKNAPNPKICQRYGASAMVLDQRVFISFNPFNVYVTQADVKPGCVLRASNIVQILQSRGLLSEEEVNTCKNGSNTWAYVGELADKPQLSCVYQSDDAQNEFLSNPKVGLGEDVYDNKPKFKNKK